MMSLTAFAQCQRMPQNGTSNLGESLAIPEPMG
jgi:hypothetical protein